jgi:ABC-type branched-subunit amino acid transport system substrate-binding protein
VEIAAALSLSGDEAPYGRPVMDGIQLAIEEANAGPGPRVALKTYDDQGTIEGARRVAGEIVASRAAVVLGPAFSFLALAAGPVYAHAGLAVLATTATADSITQNATTYRVLFKNSDQGELLATYLSRVLRRQHAAVIAVDDGYGRTLRDGFAAGAQRLGIAADYLMFKTPDEAQQTARAVAADPSRPAVVLLMLDAEAAPVIVTLRRLGVTAPMLGGDALGDDVISQRLADQPEEQRQRGWFTDQLYGISPMILDSANADTLDFARRFRARFGHDPVWEAVVGYDTAKLAVATASAVEQAAPGTAARAAAMAYLGSLNAPDRALPGLLGPIWFDQSRGRDTAIRIGRFSQGRFESAPLQIVPVSTPAADELASGAVFAMQAGRFARLQRVVYAGVFINAIPHIDLGKSSFGADFYIWLRFAKDAGPGSPDPTNVNFPNLLSGSFDHARPAEQREMSDGTTYRLWRVQGEFRNDFDLHRFPFDRQTLALPFYHATGAADRIVYVLDRRSAGVGRNGVTATADAGGGLLAAAGPRGQAAPIASPEAFRGLTQWTPLRIAERRQDLVTDSSLGDPSRVGVEDYRELSGFVATVEVKRRALATLLKTLMPLMLMTLIVYATLYFPPVLVREKVLVAVTGALSGAVLLTAVNGQLGGVGYIMAVEYAFFVFFGLTTFSIVAALTAERFRHHERGHLAIATERAAQVVFLLAIAGLLVGAWLVSASAGAAA